MTATGNPHDQIGCANELMTLAEMARFVRRSRSWVYQNLRWIPHHTVPGFRGHWFDRNEVVRWIKSGGLDEGSTAANRDAAGTDLATHRSTPYGFKPRRVSRIIFSMAYSIKKRPLKRHGVAFDLYYRWEGQKHRPLLGYNLSAEVSGSHTSFQ